MSTSKVAQGSLCSESTDDENETPINNNSSNVVEYEPEVKRVEDHWKYLVFDSKKNRSLQVMENKSSNESDNDLTSSNEIPSTIITELEVAGESSNMSDANLSHHRSTPNQGEILMDNNKKRESVAGGSQQADKSEARRKSVIFTSKRKLNSRQTEDEGLDDSGLVLNDSDEVSSPMKSDAVSTKKKSNSSKTGSSHDNNTSDEGEASLGHSSKTESTAGENQVVTHRKFFTSKRKLSFQETQDLESEEPGEIPSKRGRGKYKLRDLPQNDFPDKVNKKKSHGKRGANKSNIQNTDQVEDETEDSAVEDEPEDYQTQNTDESSSKKQAAHNNKILKLLNEGSPAKLMTLNRVGGKTAVMIHQYRKMNGKLASIRDLEKMSGWSPKFFEMFLSANNIILD